MNEFIQTLCARKSCRSYLPTQIKEEELNEILRAGTYAATGNGKQSPKIVVLQNPEDIAELERRNAEIMGKPGTHPFYGAPTVCLVLADANIRTAVEDGSLVLGNLMAAAYSLGIGSCWINRAREEFRTDEGKALLRKWGIEGDWIGVGHCILGYPDGPLHPPVERKPDYIVRIG